MGGRNVYVDLGTAHMLLDIEDGVNTLAVTFDAAGREDPDTVRGAVDAVLDSPDHRSLGLKVTGDRALEMEEQRTRSRCSSPCSSSSARSPSSPGSY